MNPGDYEETVLGIDEDGNVNVRMVGEMDMLDGETKVGVKKEDMNVSVPIDTLKANISEREKTLNQAKEKYHSLKAKRKRAGKKKPLSKFDQQVMRSLEKIRQAKSIEQVEGQIEEKIKEIEREEGFLENRKETIKQAEELLKQKGEGSE